MANLWTYEQTFNTLNTADLSGQDSWSSGTGFNVVTTDTPYEGAKHVKTAGDGSYITRSITSIESGTVYFSFRKTSSTTGYMLLLLDNDNTQSDLELVLGPLGSVGNGQIGYYSRNSSADIQIDSLTYTAATYVRVGIRFEFSTNGYAGLAQRTWQVNVNGGAWSSALETERTDGNAITRIRWGGSSELYMDFISPNYSATTTTTPNFLSLLDAGS
jgi:hypothetical protein